MEIKNQIKQILRYPIRWIKKMGYKKEISHSKLDGVMLERLSYYFFYKNRTEKFRLKQINVPNIHSKLYLSDIFKCNDQYKQVISSLVQNRICTDQDNYWHYQGSGSKGLTISLLKNLYLKGYFIDAKRLTNEQMKEIVKNTFALEVSIDLVRHHKMGLNDFPFIPKCKCP